MTKKFKVLIFFFLSLIILSYIYNNFFIPTMTEGVYINKNYKNSPIGPNIPDTLILYDNNIFLSAYSGWGKYSLSYSLGGTRILLDYNDTVETDFQTNITRLWFGKPKIMFHQDIQHCYEKTE